MSHQIETTAWTNEVPWHGLGTKVPDNIPVDGMLKAAKLNWGVSKTPLYYSSTDDTDSAETKVEGFFGLKRSDTAEVLDIVGSQYKPVQNADAFKFFKEFVETGKAKMETAGSLRKGRMIWGLANLGNDFTLAGKDKVKGYLLVASPHEQGKSLRIMFTAVRVVCNNTLTMALSSEGKAGFRMNHRLVFDEDTMARAKLILGIANEQLDTLADNATKLSKKKMKKADALSYLASVFDPEMKNAPPDEIAVSRSKPLQYAMQALDFAPGHDLLSAQGTAWGALNAVTYVVDHMLGRTADARLNKAWFGKNGNLKELALKLALDL